MERAQVREVKICLIGDSGVGKTAIATRFVQDRFAEKGLATIGVSYLTKDVEIGNMCYRLQIWDTAGQDRYRSLVPLYYRGTAAAIVVYDITELESYESVQPWVNELRRHCHDNPVITVAGNKCDMEELRRVEYADAQAKANSYGAVFMETSAKSGANTNEIFVNLCQRLLERELAPEQSETDADAEPLHLGNKIALPEKTKTGCCAR